MKLKSLIPMLNVADINVSLAFYDNALNFKVVSDPSKVDEWKWATIRSGGIELMLSENQSAKKSPEDLLSGASDNWPAIYYFYVDDVESLFNHLKTKGFEPDALEDTFYSMREFSLRDPDGHLLSFGEEMAD